MAAGEKTACIRTLPIYTVDAFSARPFSGNPAGVCPLPLNVSVDDEVLQNIAAELNLSETAFIKTLTDTDTFETGNRFGLRWFTRTTESKFCGHATLASAAVLFRKYGNLNQSITFEAMVGELVVRQEKDDIIVLNSPVGVTKKQEVKAYESLIKTLFSDPTVVEEVELCESLRYLLVRIRSGWTRAEFESWSPPIDQLESSVEPGKVFVLIVTTSGQPDAGYRDASGQPYDFVSRVFAPWAGIPEDPVTGSAHSVLPYYWSPRLSKTQFYARQCSKRGGDVRVDLQGDRVDIKGKAAFVLEGTINY